MNFYEIGKDVQVILAAASAIDKKLSEAVCLQTMSKQADEGFFAIPCVPKRKIIDDLTFVAKLHALTIISNTARGNDYLVATVSSEELSDERGDSLGRNVYLGRNELQSMVELADNLNTHLKLGVGLSYGVHEYSGSPIPVIFGIRAEWTAGAGDFTNAGNAGLLISLEAQLQANCGLRIRAKIKRSPNENAVEFRAGNQFTQEKLNALATAYFRSAVAKKGIQEFDLNNDGTSTQPPSFKRMQLAE
jgi:hypothetical protein